MHIPHTKTKSILSPSSREAADTILCGYDSITRIYGTVGHHIGQLKEPIKKTIDNLCHRLDMSLIKSAAWFRCSISVDVHPFGDGIDNGSVSFACKLRPGHCHSLPCVNLPIGEVPGQIKQELRCNNN